MKHFFLIILVFFSTLFSVQATHNRAGEITYTCISPFTYKITITTYTKESSFQADRCMLEIKYDNTDIDTIVRVNGPAGSNCDYMGVSLGNDIKKNVYTTTHTFPGVGKYSISVEDPNRNSDVINIPNSVDATFFIVDTLIISPWTNCNSSPILTNPPIDNACVYKPYYHNPGAVDTTDGDSLSYSLITCLGAYGLPIPGYSFPENLSIDPVTGTVTWDAPQFQGEYNIAILIREWRLINNTYTFIGSIIRDMQITVVPKCSNPPVIVPLDKICIEAGDTLNIAVTATDIDKDLITLTATGEPLLLSNSPATFTQPPKNDTVTGNLYWETKCSHVRNLSYQVTFKANDNSSPVNMIDIKTLDITVVGPAPKNPTASPTGNAINLTWEQSTCNEAIGYELYRKIDSVGFIPDTCETGVPSYTGYSHIATVDGLTTTTYTDNNNGTGLIHGQRYCYMLVAIYPDGAESYASVEFCTELIQDVPIITHVSVGATDNINGIDTIRWAKPLVYDADKGPYHYKVYRSDGFTTANTYIGSTSSNDSLLLTDTVFIDTSVNTKDTAHSYQIVLFSGTDSVRATQVASSVFLSSVASGHKLALIWQENVPWSNAKYVVYKYNEDSSKFLILDTTDTQIYNDSGLVNGKEYCYFIKSIGSYSISGIVNPLINYSQEYCGIPMDTSAACPPSLTVNNDCENVKNELTWTNPNNYCADDVVTYKVYYAPGLGRELKLLTTINFSTDTTYTHDGITSLVGCYAVTAIDSFLNESQFSEIVCVDNCPVYELPNVFTPNGDGENDFFIPFPYKFIKSIELKIYNRWEQVVFESIDPDIKWDGKRKDTNQYCNSGVYYYICKVNEIRLIGIVPRMLKGYIHLFRENVQPISD